MNPRVEALIREVERGLSERADPGRAAPMQAYMKTEQPFYGVPRPLRREVERQVKASFRPSDRATWEAGVRALYAQPHRETRYLALAVARHHPKFLDALALPLCEHLIRAGAWWDLVDEVAVHLVGRVLRADPDAGWAALDRWIVDEDLWVRRAAILAQIGRKDATDAERLFRYCLDQAGDRSFWIRKAIGWALREYGRAAPDAVRPFVDQHGAALSGLSRREATRRLRPPPNSSEQLDSGDPKLR